MGLVGVGLCRLPLLGRPLGGGGAVSSIFMGGGNGVCAGQKNKIIKYKKRLCWSCLEWQVAHLMKLANQIHL